ncbi:N/A [soil metagenome]
MTPTPRQVLFLGHGAERTGPPLHLAHLLGWLARERAVDAHVVVARGGDLVDDYRRLGAQVTVAARGREPLDPLPAAIRRVAGPESARAATSILRRARLVRTRPGDLIYLNAVSLPTLALLDAIPRRGARLLVHGHELGIGLGSVPADDLSRLLGTADALVAASHAVADELETVWSVDPRRLTVAHELVDVGSVQRAAQANGRAEARRRLGAGPATVLLGSVGLPDWRKAPEHLLGALWRLRRDRPDLDLRVAWIGGDRRSVDGRRLADEARRLGLADRVRHVDHVEDPAALLGGLDVFVLPSREDAFPLAVLAAAAAGLPVVSFASGGVPELVDSSLGRIVPYPDVVALAAAIGELADDHALRQQLGRAGAARVAERHDVAVGAPRTWAVAESLMEGRA